MLQLREERSSEVNRSAPVFLSLNERPYTAPVMQQKRMPSSRTLQASGASLQGFLRAMANMYSEPEHHYSCLNHLQIAGDYPSSDRHLRLRPLQ